MASDPYQQAELYPAPATSHASGSSATTSTPKVKALEALPDDLQNDLLHTYEQRRKKLVRAYILWLIIPGFHSFYVGSIKRAILFIASLLLPVIWFFWWVRCDRDAGTGRRGERRSHRPAPASRPGTSDADPGHVLHVPLT